MLLRLLAFFAPLLWTLSLSCPLDQTLKSVCKCEDSFSGVVLECDGSRNASFDPLRIFQILSDNKLQLGIVQQLSVQNTALDKLPGRLFDGLYVKKLDLSNNFLQNVSSSAFDGLENVLQILILANNSLTDLPFEALSKNNLKSLVQLDLSGNRIGDLDSDDQEFRGLPRLTDLNLSNNKICKMKRDLFTNVKDTLSTLNLGNNCLDEVPASALRGFRQLLALHMHNNSIEELGPLQFMNMPSLNLINLAKNRIKSIHPRSFLNVPNLRFIYLSDNNLTEIEPYQFRTFEHLEMLDLTRNRLRSLPPYSFAELPKLSQLYLGENELWRLEANVFANSSLIVLLLAGNRLTSLTPDMFAGLTTLQQLSLKNNQISSIAPTTFYQMPSLVVLDLSDNQLVILQPATFLAQLSLFLLDLSNNKLINVPYGAFNQRIASILLKENPLVCTERVHVVQNGVGVFLPEEPNNVCFQNQQRPSSSGSDQNSFVQSTIVDPKVNDSHLSLINSNFSTPVPKAASRHYSAPIIHAIRTPPTFSSFDPQPSIVQFPTINNSQTSISGHQQRNVISITPSNQWNLDDVSTFPPIHPASVTGVAHVSEEDEKQQQQVASPTASNAAAEGSDDDGDDDGLIRIPFLQTQRPIVGPAFAIGPAFTLPANLEPAAAKRPNANGGGNDYTLPPDVILATIPPWTTPFKINRPVTVAGRNGKGNSALPADSDLSRISFDRHPQSSAKNQSSPDDRRDDDLPQIVYKTPAPKKPQDTAWPDAATGGADDFDVNNLAKAAHNSGTIVIAVCMTVVVVFLVGAFVVVCAVRHRSRKSQRSASSRTSAYVAAQAAAMQYATLGYGHQHQPSRSSCTVDQATVNMHSGLSRYYHATPQQQQQQQSWLYNPNAIYASASQYYK